MAEAGRSGAAHGPIHLAWAPVPDAADRSARGQELLPRLLAGLGEPDAVIGHRCETCGSTEHGRPVVDGGRFAVSLSYAAGLVVAAAAQAAAIGVDVEPVGADGPLRDLAALFAPQPPPDLRGWTLIEAAVKADGRGLRIPPNQVRRTGIPSRTLSNGEVIRLPDGRTIEAAAVDGPDGYLVSIALDPGPAADRRAPLR